MSGYVFQNCPMLSFIYLPALTYAGERMLYANSTLLSFSFPALQRAGSYAFAKMSNLTSVYFPVLTSTAVGTFADCTALTSVSLPQLTSVTWDCFSGCTALSYLEFPMLTGAGTEAFEGCTALHTISIGKGYQSGSLPRYLTFGKDDLFSGCSNLQSIYLWAASVYSVGSYTFRNSPVEDGTAKIYVLPSLVSVYQSHASWSRYASQIYAIP